MCFCLSFQSSLDILPRALRIALSPRQNAPAPPKRDSLALKDEGGIVSDRRSRRVAKDIENLVPSRRSSSNSSGGSIAKTESVETVQLQEAVRQRELANANVKTLTAEVVRLAGQLRSQQVSQQVSLGSPESTHRSSRSQSPRRLDDEQASKQAKEPAVTTQLLQQLRQAMRRRKRMHMWSVIQSWKATALWGHRSNRIGEGLGRRHQNRFSHAVLDGWHRLVKQQERLEHALGCLMEKQVATAFDIWRLSSSDKGQANMGQAHMLPLPHGRDLTHKEDIKQQDMYDNWARIYGRPRTLFADPIAAASGWADPDLHRDSAREHTTNEKWPTLPPPQLARQPAQPPTYPLPHNSADVQGLIQRMDMKHYFEHIALKQMHARWSRRRLCTCFLKFAGICGKLARNTRVRRRNFVQIGARHIR